MAALAEKLNDRPRAIKEYEALLSSDHTNVEAARKILVLAQAAGDERAITVALDPDRRSRSVRYLRPIGGGAARAEEARARRRDARVPGGAADRRAPTRPRRTATSGKATCSPGMQGRGQEGSAGGARDRAELRARSGVAAQRGRRNEVGRCARRLGVAGLGVLRSSLVVRCAGRRSASSARSPLQAQPPPVPAAPDARFAGLQWTFVRIHYAAWTLPPRAGLSPFDEPWYIDAPAAEWNLSRRVRLDT